MLFRSRVEDAAADGKTAATAAVARFREGCDQPFDRCVEAEHDDAPAVGIALRNQRIDALPVCSRI